MIKNLIELSIYGLRFESATKSARLEMLFVAAINVNIKMILLYQMLGRLEFDQFKTVIIWWALEEDVSVKKLIVYS